MTIDERIKDLEERIRRLEEAALRTYPWAISSA